MTTWPRALSSLIYACIGKEKTIKPVSACFELRRHLVPWCLALVGLLTVAHQVNAATDLPASMSFAALVDHSWAIYVVEEEGAIPRRISTQSEPRSPAYDAERNVVGYVTQEGNVREVDLATAQETLVAEANDGLTFTQLEAGDPAKGFSWVVVGMHGGESSNTDLFGVTRTGIRPIHQQISAQFEPSLSPDRRTLLYANVHCVAACGAPIAEIWRLDLVTRAVTQLAMLNGVSREPVMGHDGTSVYFANNGGGPFHIWRLNLKSGKSEQVTGSMLSDVSPAISAEGTLYFLRLTGNGARLHRLTTGGQETPVDLGISAQDVRQLKIFRKVGDSR